MECNYSGIHYITNGKVLPWNSGFGVVVNRRIVRFFSVELTYRNAWINEHYAGADHRTVAHFAGVRLAFSGMVKNQTYSGLIGYEISQFRDAPCLGFRWSSPLTERFALHFTGLVKYSTGYLGGGNWSPRNSYLSNTLVLNASVGLAWNFSIE